MRILLAEGDAERLAWLQRCITEDAHEVTVCTDGERAWQAWQEGDHPVLVLASDLPGNSGLEICRRIRRLIGDETYFVILLVSKQTPSDLRKALEAGADDVVVRPIDDDELRLRLRMAEKRIAARSHAREEHRSFMELLAQAPDLIQTVALDGQMLYVNRAWCEALGYAEREIGDLSFFDLVRPRHRAAVRKAFRWVTRGRGIRRMQTELIARDGRVMSVEGSLSPRYRGRTPTSVRVILRDVSRRKRAETVLRNVLEGTSATTGQDFFRSLVKHLSRALEVQHALVAERLPGVTGRLRTLAVWSGETFAPNREFEPSELPRVAPLGTGHENGDAAGPTLFPGARFLAESGASSYLGVPLVNAEGGSIGLLCVFDDEPVRAGPDALRILSTFAQRAGAELERQRTESERRELDRRMQESQKLESMGVLAGGIAHDFNNLLTSIMGYASLARRNSIPGSPAERYLGDIEKASRRAADLAMQMLAYSGKGQFVIQPLDLREVIRETTNLLRTDINSRGVSLDCDLPEELSAIEGDATQVRQVLMNLILNAAQAMEEGGGTVLVRVREGDVAAARLGACYVGPELEPGRYVKLCIRDSGCGMDAATIKRIFDPFFTTKTGGRGLGLAAVVGIVRGHNGALHVESAPGEGTTVSVYLPPCALEVSPEPVVEAALPIRGEGLILVVDDEEGLRRLTTDILESGGYRVVTAADGREGVEMLRRGAGEIDAVLLDMTMPVMGGVEAFQAMRAIRPEVRVVVSSGYTKSEAINRFEGAAPNGFIQKPYAAADLLTKMGEVVAAGTVQA